MADITIAPEFTLAAACTSWQSGRDGGSTLLRAAARALTGIPHYFTAAFITEKEEEARGNPAALQRAATLLHAIADAPLLTADQWAERHGVDPANFAGRGLGRKQTEDEQIARQLRGGVIDMPLWGVSLDPAVAQRFGTSDSRWIFQIEGPFPAVAAWSASGIKPEERELICGGRYRWSRRTTRMVSPRFGCGSSASSANGGYSSAAAPRAGRGARNRSSALRRGALDGRADARWLELRFADKGIVDVTVFDEDPNRRGPSRGRPVGEPDRLLATWVRPAPSRSNDLLTMPAHVDTITDYLANRRDPRWPLVRSALIDRLLTALVPAADARGFGGGSIDLPGGGYVQWTRVAEEASVHVEFFEGGYDSPMSAHWVEALGRFGWNPLDDTFRNAWFRASDPEHRLHLGPGSTLFDPADRILATATVLAGASLNVLHDELVE